MAVALRAWKRSWSSGRVIAEPFEPWFPGRGKLHGRLPPSQEAQMLSRSWLLCACALVSGAPPGVAQNSVLEGTVTSNGKPLAGALVFISRAWPREGLAYYCPSCYVDCTK